MVLARRWYFSITRKGVEVNRDTFKILGCNYAVWTEHDTPGYSISYEGYIEFISPQTHDWITSTLGSDVLTYPTMEQALKIWQRTKQNKFVYGIPISQRKEIRVKVKCKNCKQCIMCYINKSNV